MEKNPPGKIVDYWYQESMEMLPPLEKIDGKIQKYMVRSKLEETFCDNCGSPIYSGEYVYYFGVRELTGDEPIDEIYCSKRCFCENK